MSSNGTKVVILSSPSGGGKSTIIRHLLEQFPDIWHSVSATTRAPRHGELEGREYHFVHKEQFQELITKNALAEWAEVHDEWYGTPLEPLREHQKQGFHIVLDLDVIGTFQMKERWPNILTIYLLAPSRAELERRLHKRKTETEERIQHRLMRYEMEQSAAGRYDKQIVNSHIAETVERVIQTIESWHHVVKF